MMILNQFDEGAMHHYHGTKGYFKREPLPLMAGLWDDNGTLKALAISASGTVGFRYLAGGTGLTDDIVGLVWGKTSTETDRWVYPWTVPWDYRRDCGASVPRSKIIVRVKVRKVDLGAGVDNPNLALHLMASWHSSNISDAGAETDGDAAFEVLSAVVVGKTLANSAVIPAMAVAGSEAAYRWMYFDVTAAMSQAAVGATPAQIAELKPGAMMTFKLFPSEALDEGTAEEIELEVGAVDVFYTGHLVPENKSVKNAVHG